MNVISPFGKRDAPSATTQTLQKTGIVINHSVVRLDMKVPIRSSSNCLYAPPAINSWSNNFNGGYLILDG